MGAKSCSFSIIADIFACCVKLTHLNSSELQTVKTSAFVEVLTLQAHLISSTWLLVSPLIPEVRVYLTSHRTSEYCENLLFQTVIDHN